MDEQIEQAFINCLDKINSQHNESAVYVDEAWLKQTISHYTDVNNDMRTTINLLDSSINQYFQNMGLMHPDNCRSVLNLFSEVVSDFNNGINKELVNIVNHLSEMIRSLPKSPAYTPPSLKQVTDVMCQNVSEYRDDFINASLEDHCQFANAIYTSISKLTKECLNFKESVVDLITDYFGLNQSLIFPPLHGLLKADSHINNVIMHLKGVLTNLKEMEYRVTSAIRAQQRCSYKPMSAIG